jgi:hypothetical protein
MMFVRADENNRLRSDWSKRRERKMDPENEDKFIDCPCRTTANKNDNISMCV